MNYALFHRLEILLRILVFIFIAISLFFSTGVMTIMVVPSFFPEAGSTSFIVIQNILAGLATALPAINILILITFFVWMYKIYDYFDDLRFIDLKFSPATAIISFLVPFANLIIPYWVFRDLWKARIFLDDLSLREYKPVLIMGWCLFNLASYVSIFLFIFISKLLRDQIIFDIMLIIFFILAIAGQNYVLSQLVQRINVQDRQLSGVEVT